MIDDRLKGWKEIADFLHVQVRTAQRWEHALHLPIHRIETAKSAIVFASREEVDGWLRTAEGDRARFEQDGSAALTENGGHGVVTTAELGAEAASLQRRDSTPVAPETPDPGAPGGPPVQVRKKTRLSRLRNPAFLISAIGVLLFVVWPYGRSLLAPRGAFAKVTGQGQTQDRSRGTANLPSAGHAPGSVKVRLTLVDGRTLRLGLTTGALATLTVAGQTYALSGESSQDKVSVHIYRFDAMGSARTNAPVELDVVSLTPGERKETQHTVGLRAIEWLTP